MKITGENTKYQNLRHSSNRVFQHCLQRLTKLQHGTRDPSREDWKSHCPKFENNFLYLYIQMVSIYINDFCPGLTDNMPSLISDPFDLLLREVQV